MLYNINTHCTVHTVPTYRLLRQHLSMLLSSFTDCRGDEDPVPPHLWRDTGLWNQSISSVRMLVQNTVRRTNSKWILLFLFLKSSQCFSHIMRFFFYFQLQIHYDKQLGNLIVHVLQARNLVQRDNNGYSDPFVKVYLLPGRGWVKGVETAHTPGLNVSGQEQDSQRRMNDTHGGNLLGVPVFFFQINVFRLLVFICFSLFWKRTFECRTYVDI